ncbi:iron-containing redox enzyme family protein [Nonomuraea sp. B19D2]|uniref:iron-containing redox enzyme family protein n=1 Tax=Nonomuraea sp. B19D2 TaxID=3159561 RepID=UPI0032DA2E6C
MPISKSYNTYSTLQRPEFRKRVEALLDQFQEEFYKDPEAQKMLNNDFFSLELYKRHNIETILRIVLRRPIDPLIANYWASRNSKLCKEWALYGAEEGRHDRMFARDMHLVGVTDEEIYSTPPTFATELLTGYYYYTLATDGPLGAMAAVFYLESVADRTQPAWLDVMEQHIGKDKTRGARAHLNLDEEDEHVDLVWNMIMNVVKTEEDEEAVIRHLTKINALFIAYFFEVNEISEKRSAATASQQAMAAPLAAVKTAVRQS